MNVNDRQAYAAAKREWEEAVGKAGIEPDGLCYGPDAVADMDVVRDAGFPGAYPYTRGVRSTMYRGRLWTMRQFAGFGSARESNERYKMLLERGQTGLSVAFDTPTIMGRDSDHPLALGEVGRCGVAVDCLPDMERLFQGIPLDKVSVSMTINAPAIVILALFIAAAEKQGVSADLLQGTVQNDILKEYHAQNTWIFPPEPSLRLIGDTLRYCGRHAPKWNTISISGYHIREAGSTALQELAFTLADGFAYVDTGLAAGLQVDDFAPRLSFFFNSHSNLFEEIAKFRAARRIWARHMRERYGAKDPRSWMLRFHVQTAGCSLTAQQPENNIVRTAVQALAAVLGGTQSLHTNSMDEALGLPTESAVTLALRTQQILAHETGATDVIDPLGGAWFVEHLTNRMEQEAEAYFRKIEDMGGMLPAIAKGFFRREIERAAYENQRDVEAGRTVVVGVNRYRSEGHAPDVEILRIDPAVEAEQKERLARFKANRDRAAVDAALRRLERDARGDAELMPPVLDAVKAGATLGEICDVFRAVFGEFSERQMAG